MKCFRPITFLILGIVIFSGSSYMWAGQAELPKAELPALLVSCGQSPGANMLKAIFMRLKLQHEPKAYELNPLASAEDLQTAKSAGTPFKSIIIVMGASLKGMGAAGISIDDEIARTKKLIAEARSQGITIIGAHIEGMKRRAQGASPGDNTDEMSIDTVAPESDFLLVNKDGDGDLRFTTISKEKNIPMVTVEKNLELMEVLKSIYTQ